MAGLGTNTAHRILEHITDRQEWTTNPDSNDDVWVSLHTADPGGAGSFELTSGWYSRAQPTNGWNNATINGATNNGDITFPTASGSSLTITHVGLWDAETGGDFLIGIALDESVTVSSGVIPRILNGAFTVVPGVAYSEYLIPFITDHLLGTTDMFFDVNVWVALYTDNPGADDSGTEASGGGYSRKQISTAEPASGATDNTNLIDYGTASANLGTISHFAIRRASSGGDPLVFGPWDTAFVVSDTDDYSIPIGNLDLTAIS